MSIKATLFVIYFCLLSAVGGSLSAFANQNCAAQLVAQWVAKFDTTEDQLGFLVSLLKEHPNLVTANLKFRRNLLDAYANMPELLNQLGEHGASTVVGKPSIVKVRYVPSGDFKYDEAAIRGFLDARADDLRSLAASRFGREGAPDLPSAIEQIKRASFDDRGQFDEKAFKKQTNRVLRLAPFLFDAEGRTRFQSLEGELPRLLETIQNSTPAELENGYGDLYKHHLQAKIEELSKRPGMGQVRVLFESMRNQVIQKDLKAALTPVGEGGAALQARDLSVETLPAVVGLVRGCYGGDCSILSVPYYPMVKGTKIHFIRKSAELDAPPVGYAFSVEVTVDGRKVPYILTINGETLLKSDVEMVVKAVAKDYGSNEVILPDFGRDNQALVNTEDARSGMTFKDRRKVTVEFPKGWQKVDAFPRGEASNQYTNYYDSSRLRAAYLSDVGNDPRVIGQFEASTGAVARYQPPSDLGKISKIERAVLAVQALSGSKSENRAQEVLRTLGLSEVELKAAVPLVELSPDRPLKLAEFNTARQQLGFSFKDILGLELRTRARTLKSLYDESPGLFAEHRTASAVIGHPKYIEGVTRAYGSKNPELVADVLRAADISPSEALAILKQAKESLDTRDIVVAQELESLVRGKSIEANVAKSVVDGFVANPKGETSLARALDLGLDSRDPAIRQFTTRLLTAESIPADSQYYKNTNILRAYREILQSEPSLISNFSKKTFERARQKWLASDQTAAELKASVVFCAQGTGKGDEFGALLAQIPKRQVPQVQNAIEQRSFIFTFRALAEKKGVLADFAGKVTPESLEFSAIIRPGEKATFTMGSAEDGGTRLVTLTEPYEMGRTPITQAVYWLVTGKNPSHFKKNGQVIGEKKFLGFMRGQETVDWDLPAEQFSYDDFYTQFVKALNEADPKHRYDLATEAQWEYAARGGTETKWSHGDDVQELKESAWYSDNAGSQTHPVAALKPNPFGLFDMHGNVWEWNKDWYGNIPGGHLTDPKGPGSGSTRVVRGGSWSRGAETLRSSQRDGDRPGYRNRTLGARLVRTPR